MGGKNRKKKTKEKIERKEWVVFLIEKKLRFNFLLFSLMFNFFTNYIYNVIFSITFFYYNVGNNKKKILTMHYINLLVIVLPIHGSTVKD